MIMVVEATIADAEAYARYMNALVASGLFQRFGGIPLATGKVREILEGDYDDTEIVALVEFPSSAKAHEFWDCPEYREITKLRDGAGRFQVGLWRKFREQSGS
jgi:uncharacterized protein (DUF1330 family)